MSKQPDICPDHAVTDKGDFVVLGKVVGAYGVKGWVRVHPFGDDPLGWRGMRTWWFTREAQSRPGADAPVWQAMRLRDCRLQGDSLVALLEGCADRSSAEAMRGLLFGAPRAELPQTGADEFYWGDLIGLPVRNLQNVQLGKVEKLLETGANDVLVVVDEAGQERLIPYVDSVVLTVDLDDGIRVDWGSDW